MRREARHADHYSVTGVPRTRFGRPLGICLICFQKTVWGVLLLAVAVTLLVLRAAHQTEPFQALFAGELREDRRDFLANAAISLIPTLSRDAELSFAAGTLVYAASEALHAWGLWYDILWVEVLVIAETAALLPYEGWELGQHATPFKVVYLAVSALTVWYLIARYRRKREAHLARQLRERGPGEASERSP